jgi:hypothetical protein|tara:strand:+ start:1806 stop:2015 length:210 start_codon:yes stop_codon:yes gene_type:complete
LTRSNSPPAIGVTVASPALAILPGPGRGLGGSSAGFILSIGDGFINGPINNFGDACLGGEKANDENFGK